MQVRYRITLEDYRDARSLIWKSQRRLAFLIRFVLPVILAVFVFTFAEDYRRHPDQLNPLLLQFQPLLIIVGALVLYWFVLRPLSIRRTYSKNPVLHREITADFDATGMDASDDSGSRWKVPWSHFNRFSEGKRVFILGTPGNIFNIIAKSGMSAEQQETFRILLKQNVVRK